MASPIQRWTVFSSSMACALLSLTCALGLLASIAVTFATQGRALLAACTFGSPGLLVLVPDCPFDPTRIYVSAQAWDCRRGQGRAGGVGGMGGDTQGLIRGGKGSWRPTLHPAPCAPPQSSSLCLWGISLVFCVAESVFAVRCAQLAHQLLELRPWWGKSSHHMVRPATPSISPDSPYFLGALAGKPRLVCPYPLHGAPALRTGAVVFPPG